MHRPIRPLVIVALLALPALGDAPTAAAQGPPLFVNTTEDLPVEGSHCLPNEICTLRAALEKAEGRQGVVQACYDPAEVPWATTCGFGAKPLSTSDVGYDPDTQRWTFELLENSQPFTFSEGRTTVDFRLGVKDWDGPEDNHIVIDPGIPLPQLFIIESTDNRFAGFEVRGDFDIAAFVLRASLFDEGASNNVLGPGLVLAGITQGVGIKFRDPVTVGNRVIGTWCGVTGDGTEVSAIQDDCVQFDLQSSGNTIGGPTLAERNVFAVTRVGAGVGIQAGATNNTVRDNWFGLDAAGNPASSGLETGIKVVEGSHNTLITGNVVANSRTAGITVFGQTQGTQIEGNIAGETQDGRCAGNKGYGIKLEGGPKDSDIVDNRVACNEAGGILLSGAPTRNNTISRNSVTQNNNHPIDVVQGANSRVRPPSPQIASESLVRGQACTNCQVQVFSDPAGEAEFFEGQVEADGFGLFEFVVPDGGRFQARTVTLTATQGRDTSGLSDPITASGGATPTPGAATATPTRAPDSLFSILLPWSARGARF